tara:strand:- start:28246 stop:28365 length:120 start_codon:yes stop_codon:yes gene_type:complete
MGGANITEYHCVKLTAEINGGQPAINPIIEKPFNGIPVN